MPTRSETHRERGRSDLSAAECTYLRACFRLSRDREISSLRSDRLEFDRLSVIPFGLDPTELCRTKRTRRGSRWVSLPRRQMTKTNNDNAEDDDERCGWRYLLRTRRYRSFLRCIRSPLSSLNMPQAVSLGPLRSFLRLWDSIQWSTLIRTDRSIQLFWRSSMHYGEAETGKTDRPCIAFIF